MSQENSQKKGRGRPKKSFDKLSVITKRHNAKKLLEQFSIEELDFTLEKGLKSSGFCDAAKLIKNVMKTPSIASKYIKSSANQKVIIDYTPEEALALMVDMKLSKRQYQLMYFGAKEKNSCIYPSYGEILKAKKRCYPPNYETQITEIGFQIELQTLLNITVQRLVETLTEEFTQHNQKLCLISKWGFDGASDQSRYKQKFQVADADDCAIFTTSLVPIVLHAFDDPESVHWQNMKPSSTTLCRPLRLQFRKETEKFVLQTAKEVSQEIKDLVATTLRIEDGVSIEVHHQLICTMVDGKICNHLSGNKSTLCCFICKATTKQMNDLHTVYQRPKDTIYYQYGLSTLHAWIRFMECVLHISYNKSFGKWSAKTLKHKKERMDKKIQIQNDFREKTGLIVDQVLQGKGTTNDGNTARRFFRDYESTAKITGFNVELLKRFAVILQVMASGQRINVTKFENYTKETAVLYVKLYWWYYMPPTVHKILIHGSDVIRFAPVPIGQLSEEVQETRHKEIRRYRLQNTRKTSRIKTNEDLLHSLLISSDPLISSHRQIENSNKMELFKEAKNLIADTNSEFSDEE